jgi:hypothetical protein
VDDSGSGLSAGELEPHRGDNADEQQLGAIRDRQINSGGSGIGTLLGR